MLGAERHFLKLYYCSYHKKQSDCPIHQGGPMQPGFAVNIKGAESVVRRFRLSIVQIEICGNYCSWFHEIQVSR